MKSKRTVFFLSDRTGITAETLGHSLLTQFDNVEFDQVNVPFIQSEEKAIRTVEMINRAAREDGVRPLLFCTLINEDITNILRESEGLLMDFFGTFIGPLEQELQMESSHTVGRAHGIASSHNYRARIDAMHYALDNDDGVSIKDYDKADAILIGVSRSGKTPTSLYLALQFGVYTANYPLIQDDLERMRLPDPLEPYRHKLYGLSIQAERLVQIRAERRPGSRYASLEQCRDEVRSAERLFRHEHVPWLETTSRSIEEIATQILDETGIPRRFY
ncbi:MAG TPA: pyruvate, water dikinase regulatory protein [Gammaproteobacteria bacterium]|nr:pyruvate, water dikinase regulatory protein [Gammaproteobacteria bacterium]